MKELMDANKFGTYVYKRKRKVKCVYGHTPPNFDGVMAPFHLEFEEIDDVRRITHERVDEF